MAADQDLSAPTAFSCIRWATVGFTFGSLMPISLVLFAFPSLGVWITIRAKKAASFFFFLRE